jgi:hypothetical protein
VPGDLIASHKTLPLFLVVFSAGRPHTTPMIVETENGTQWSVDSWTRGYGKSPDIITIAEWQNGN